MRRRVCVACAVALVASAVVIGACGRSEQEGASSTTELTIVVTVPSTTPPSTLPEKQLKPLLDEFFAMKGGKDLMRFEEITKRLNARPVLRKPDCQPFIQRLEAIGSPDYFTAQTTKIPDPYLSEAFRREVSAKRLYLEACNSGQPLPDDAPDKVAPYATALHAELAKHGYST